jgi:hypothetical protein
MTAKAKANQLMHEAGGCDCDEKAAGEMAAAFTGECA